MDGRATVAARRGHVRFIDDKKIPADVLKRSEDLRPTDEFA